MPSQEAHRAKAKHNQGFIEQIGDEFADWVAIVAFYKAVHLVEELRAVHGEHSRGHTERRNFLQTKHPKIWGEFYALFNFSMQARYYCTKIDVDTIREQLIQRRLPALERLVESEIGKQRRRKG